MSTKFGYVAIIGKPNAGKSTLLNSILGEKLSIVTSKPETTRRSVLGIYSDADTQMVFLDTPGIVPRPKFELHRQMLSYIHHALQEANVVLFIVDITDPIRSIKNILSHELCNEIRNNTVKTILVVNKMDALEVKASALPKITELIETGLFADNVAISALNNKFITELINVIKKHLPEGSFVYDAEQLSTQPQYFFVSEFIREQVFTLFKDEIPYSIEVKVVQFEERENSKWYINAEIIVDRQSQKGIIIGSKGQALKEIGSRSRLRIEEHLGKEVFLEIFVKVREEWRDSERQLHDLGYEH